MAEATVTTSQGIGQRTSVAGPLPTIRDTEERDYLIAGTAAVSNLAVIGAPGEWRDKPSAFPAVVEEHCTIREFARVHAGCERHTVIGEGTLLMAGSHVGHDAQLGKHCEVAPNAVIGGCVTIGDRVRIGMGATIVPHVTIGDNVRIGAGSVVTKDIPVADVPQTWVGSPARRIR